MSETVLAGLMLFTNSVVEFVFPSSMLVLIKYSSSQAQINTKSSIKIKFLIMIVVVFGMEIHYHSQKFNDPIYLLSGKNFEHLI